MTKHSDGGWRDRFYLILIVGLAIVVMMLVGNWVWRKYRLPAGTKSTDSSPVSLQADASHQVISNDCFAFRASLEFQIINYGGCRINAYARPQKYRYINVDTNFTVNSQADLEAQWRGRWLTLGASQVERSAAEWGGRSAIRLVDRSTQNQEKFVTYLMFVPGGVRLRNGIIVKAFELRGWGTTAEDQGLVDQVAKDWDWRF